MERYGFVRFALPLNDRGRPAKLRGDLVIEYQRVGEEKWIRLYNSGVDLPLAPGPLRYRAHSGDMRFSGTLEVVSGETKDAPILFSDDR